MLHCLIVMSCTWIWVLLGKIGDQLCSQVAFCVKWAHGNMKTIPAEAELHSQWRSNVSYGNMVLLLGRIIIEDFRFGCTPLPTLLSQTWNTHACYLCAPSNNIELPCTMYHGACCNLSCFSSGSNVMGSSSRKDAATPAPISLCICLSGLLHRLRLWKN